MIGLPEILGAVSTSVLKLAGGIIAFTVIYSFTKLGFVIWYGITGKRRDEQMMKEMERLSQEVGKLREILDEERRIGEGRKIEVKE